MLKENTNISLECDFNKLLSVINTTSGISYARRINNNIKTNLFPITKEFLQNHYLNNEYGNFKTTAKNINCAADVFSFFLVSYGKKNTTGTASAASGSNSSGFNPFLGFNADLGFNLGAIGSWLWLILIGIVIYKVQK